MTAAAVTLDGCSYGVYPSSASAPPANRSKRLTLVFAQSLTPAARPARVSDLRGLHRRVKRNPDELTHLAQHGLGIADQLLVTHLEVMETPRADTP